MPPMKSAAMTFGFHTIAAMFACCMNAAKSSAVMAASDRETLADRSRRVADRVQLVRALTHLRCRGHPAMPPALSAMGP